MIRYTATPDTAARQWHISLKFHHNGRTPQAVKLANWTPGSYMIRDFSRHIIRIDAYCNGQAVSLRQTAKNIWHLPDADGEYEIRYLLYAADLSVRACYLDGDRAFQDGAAFFLYLDGRTQETHSVEFKDMPHNWRAFTTLPQTAPDSFQAASYAELIDYPIEWGANIDLIEFEADGIPHRIAVSGHRMPYDRERLRTDCRRICENALAQFDRPAPFTEYLFLLHVGDNLYGGLEHISSTALHADRRSLPALNEAAEPSEAYTQLLGLISHEYYHSWNVKSVKPAAFLPYDLDSETYTEQLWAFEGITSYYDDLLLARSRTISPEHYLQLLAATLTRVRRTLGRKQQTLAQSSFAAWHKYYKQDENSANAITSYYQQGSLAALCLDLTIRNRSDNAHSLDSVMRQLYADWLDTRTGLAEGEWQERAQTITGLDLQDFFQAALYSTAELPLADCLKKVGIELRWLPAPRSSTGGVVGQFDDSSPAPDTGCRHRQHADRAELTVVLNGSAAEQAGLMPKDNIIAVDGFACTDFAAQTATAVGDSHTLHFFRHGVLHQARLTVRAAEADTAFLKITDPQALSHWLFND